MDAYDDDDFYVEDEPIENVRADFARGQKGVTAPRRWAQTAYLMVSGRDPEGPVHNIGGNFVVGGATVAAAR